MLDKQPPKKLKKKLPVTYFLQLRDLKGLSGIIFKKTDEIGGRWS